MFAIRIISITKIIRKLLSFNLSGLGFNKDKNNVFYDESNNYIGPITAAGNTSQGSAGPYGDKWSWYFKRSSADYLTVAPNSSFAPGTGNFTLEFWASFSALPGTGEVLGIFQTDTDLASPTNNKILAGLWNESGTIRLLLARHTTDYNTQPQVAWQPNLGEWYHFAFVRSSGTTLIYINGELKTIDNSTALNGVSIGQNGICIGAVAGSGYMDGYISNLRYDVGNAIYTGDFKAPIAPAEAISSTVLLTCKTPYLADRSGNNFTVVANSAPNPSPFVPFNSVDITEVPGRSVFFNGSTDYLSLPMNAALDFGSGDFTAEAFCYITSSSTGTVFYINGGSSSGYAAVRVGISAGQAYVLMSKSGNSWDITSGLVGPNLLNQWAHIAVTRSSGTIRLFVNGTQIGSNYSITGSLMTGNVNWIGYQPLGEFFTGHISNIRIVKGTALYTANFTVPATALTNISGTSLLTCQGNTFADGSSNNFTITANGTPRTTARSPFITRSVTTTVTPVTQSISGLFDGTGDYLTIPNNAALNMEASDFTIECWFYPTATPGTAALFSKRATTGTFGGISVQFTNSLLPQLYTTVNGSSWGISATSTVACTLNTWNHIAVTRLGNTWCLLINGQVGISQVLSGTVPSNSAAFTIGAGAADGSNVISASYISNFRVVKGTAVYTSSFSVPTTPLTNISNTSLIACQSENLIDASGNGFAITTNGDVAASSDIPFTTFQTNSGATLDASMYFDGSGDSLRATGASALTLDNSDFTIEAWVYIIPGQNQQTLLNFNPHTTIAISLNRTGIGDTYVYLGNGSSWLCTPCINSNSASNNLSFNSWNHVALVRRNSQITLYHNGVSAGTTSSMPSGMTGTVTIGALDGGSSEFFKGYISNLRIVKGTAVYTSSFTPPSSVSEISGTSLLLKGNNAAIFDATGRNTIETVGDAKISTSQSKWGTGSMYFDGTGDYLNVPTNPDSIFGTGDFTIECWVRPSGPSQGIFHVATATPLPGTVTGIALATAQSGTNGWHLYWANQQNSSTAVGVTYNQWHHVAVCRNGSTIRVFINGVLSQSQTDTTNYTSSCAVIGGFYSTSFLLNGYINDFRITRGVARYIGNFTPPGQL